MFRIETGLALAGLGLHILWIFYLAAFYTALSRPLETTGILLVLQPLMIGMFISGIPGFGLAGVTYVLSKRCALKTVSMILIAQGIILPLGMAYDYTLTANILAEYKSDMLFITPQIFLAVGFVLIGLGAHLARLKPVKSRTKFS
jgi:hypothetical protein